MTKTIYRRGAKILTTILLSTILIGITFTSANIPPAFAGHTFPTINTVGPNVGVKATTFELGDPGGIFVDCTFASRLGGDANIRIFRDSPRDQLGIVSIVTTGPGSESTTFVITDTATFTVDTYLISCDFQETLADHNDSVSHRINIVVPPITQVEIDIKPGSDPSSVNCKNLKGNVPVAIFTDDNFDATTIDIEIVSMSLVGLEPITVTVTEVHGELHPEDVDGDGDTDAVLHLDKAGVCEATNDATLKETVEVELTGKTTDGTQFVGIGDIRIVNRSNN